MKYAAIAILAFAIGVWGGHQWQSPQHSAEPPPAANLDSLKKKLQELSEGEYQEYLRLKESPEKSRKAEELLNKIMLLFIADLGLRLHVPPPPPLPTAPPPAAPVTDNSANASAHRRERKETAPPRTWTANENAITSARSTGEAVPNLKAAEIPNLFDELKAAGILSPAQASNISGDYIGEINRTDKPEVWSVEWSVEARLENGELVGKQDVKLGKEGKVFSHTNGDGPLKDFTAAKDSAAIFVKANGDQGYMQLYPVDAQAMVGTYYQRKGLDQYAPSGTVVLHRR